MLELPPVWQRPHLQEGAQRAYSLKNFVGDEFEAPTASHTSMPTIAGERTKKWKRPCHPGFARQLMNWSARGKSTTSARATG
jgi:hypothetical protein